MRTNLPRFVVGNLYRLRSDLSRWLWGKDNISLGAIYESDIAVFLGIGSMGVLEMPRFGGTDKAANWLIIDGRCGWAAFYPDEWEEVDRGFPNRESLRKMANCR